MGSLSGSNFALSNEGSSCFTKFFAWKELMSVADRETDLLLLILWELMVLDNVTEGYGETL